MIDHCEILARQELPEDCPAPYTLQRLTGDASSRSYFRIQLPEGSTVMLMKMPEAFDETDFEYLKNYELFRSLGLELAQIYHMVPSKGYVFLQDIGDATFYELYKEWNEQTRLHYFSRAIDSLRKIEKGKPETDLAFDTEKLNSELQFFKEHFLRGLKKIDFTSLETETLDHYLLELARELSQQPRVFCHRDYHSRNLMVQDDKLYIIDFQDARFGPVTYDLASLCYDSYIQHSRAFLDHVERLFFTYHPDPHAQRFEYPRMCLQRNLKALSTFGFQAVRLNRPFYLAFVPPTLNYVKKHLEKLPEYKELNKVLANHLPELR